MASIPGNPVTGGGCGHLAKTEGMEYMLVSNTWCKNFHAKL